MKTPPLDELGEATDRLVLAMKALMPADRHAALDTFGLALSDWCAVIIGRASSQSASAFLSIYGELDRKLTQTNRRIDRRQTKDAGTRTAVEDLRDRVELLEKALGNGR